MWPGLSFPVALEVFAYADRMLSVCSWSLHLQTEICFSNKAIAPSNKNLVIPSTFYESSMIKVHLNMEEKAHKFCFWAWCHKTNMLGESQECSLSSYPPLPTCSAYNIIILFIYLFPCVCKRATAWKSYCIPYIFLPDCVIQGIYLHIILQSQVQMGK